MAREGLPGGARVAITGTAIAVDLTVFAGYELLIFCDEQDINYCFAPSAANTTLLTSATAASVSALVAKPLGTGTKMERRIGSKNQFLVVATQTSTGTLVIEPVGRA